MTRATGKPVVRAVAGSDGEYVLEVRDRTLRLRPKGSRRGGPAEIEITYGKVYLRAMVDRVEEKRQQKRRKR